MEQEIELKIMLASHTIGTITKWLNHLPTLSQQDEQLINIYYDTADLYFAQQKMGLRVRGKNQCYELTLKTQGQIIGGLHIRPEYNLAIPTATPDLNQLINHYNLTFLPTNITSSSLLATFSTNFNRQKRLIQFNHSQIEIALDQGEIKNLHGKEAISEIEFELKQGTLADLFALLTTLPAQNGMWLSSLSKAERGYLVGNTTDIAKNVKKLTACQPSMLSPIEQYQYEQQLADYLRLTEASELYQCYRQYHTHNQSDIEIMQYLTSYAYLQQNLAKLIQFY